jgi:peroxiredoxin
MAFAGQSSGLHEKQLRIADFSSFERELFFPSGVNCEVRRRIHLARIARKGKTSKGGNVERRQAVKYHHLNGQIVKYLIVAAAALSFTALRAQDKQPLIGETAPAFALQGLDGKTYSLAGSEGKYTVLHFATTWCPFCNAEAPHLEELSKSYGDKRVRIFIVDVKESKEQVAKWAGKFNFSFPVLLDPDGSVSSRYAPEGVQPALARDEVPLASNLIIDPEGTIRFYSLLNTTAFDAKLTKVRQTLDVLLGKGE